VLETHVDHQASRTSAFLSLLPRSMASGSADAGAKPDQYADPVTVTPDQLAFLPHDNAGPKLNGVIWSLTALSGLVLGLRVYCRLSRRKGLWWDDGFLIAAWVR
jgi:hypothetical protein